MDNIKRFTFRLPADLFSKIEKLAQQNHRSINSEVIVAIEKYLQSLKSTSKN